MKLKSLLVFLLLFSFSNYAQSQSNKLIFSPPNENYSPIELPTYKGLPRFGVFNQYIYNPENFRKVAITNKKEGIQINKYFFLLEIKYLSEFYQTLDVNMPASLKYNSSTKAPQNLKHPVFAERHLAKVVKNLRREPTENKFFYPFNKDRSPATKIDRVADYKKFMASEYLDLKNWAEELWSNDEVIGYSVVEVVLEQYHTDGQGYFLKLGENQNAFTLIGSGAPSIFDIKFRNKPNYNQDVADVLDNKGQILFELSESEAEKLEERFKEKRLFSRDRNAYLVFKIRLYRGVNDGLEDNSFRYSPRLELLYNVESPVAEIYEDIALSQKLGDIDLNNLIFKD